MLFLDFRWLHTSLDVLLWMHATFLWFEVDVHTVPLGTGCQRVVLELVYFPPRAQVSAQDCSDLCDMQFEELMNLIYTRVPGPHLLQRKKPLHAAYLNPERPVFNVDECVHHRLFCFNTADAWLVNIDEEKADLKCVQGPASPICTSANLVNKLRWQYALKRQPCETSCDTCMCRRFLFMLCVRHARQAFRKRIFDALTPPQGLSCTPDEICQRFTERPETIPSGWSCLKGHYVGDVSCDQKHMARCEACFTHTLRQDSLITPCLDPATMIALLQFSQRFDKWFAEDVDHLMDDEVRNAMQELKEIETRYYVNLDSSLYPIQDLTDIDNLPRTGHLYADLFDQLLQHSSTLARGNFAAESSTARTSGIQDLASGHMSNQAQVYSVNNFDPTGDETFSRLSWQADQVYANTVSDVTISGPLSPAGDQMPLAENLNSFAHRTSPFSHPQYCAAAGDICLSNDEHQIKRPRLSEPIDQTLFSRQPIRDLTLVGQREIELGQSSSVIDLTPKGPRMSSGPSSRVDPDNLQFSDFFRDVATHQEAPAPALGAHDQLASSTDVDPDNLQFSDYFAAIGDLSDETRGLSTAVGAEPDADFQGLLGEIDGIL